MQVFGFSGVCHQCNGDGWISKIERCRSCRGMGLARVKPVTTVLTSKQMMLWNLTVALLKSPLETVSDADDCISEYRESLNGDEDIFGTLAWLYEFRNTLVEQMQLAS